MTSPKISLPSPAAGSDSIRSSTLKPSTFKNFTSAARVSGNSVYPRSSTLPPSTDFGRNMKRAQPAVVAQLAAKEIDVVRQPLGLAGQFGLDSPRKSVDDLGHREFFHRRQIHVIAQCDEPTGKHQRTEPAKSESCMRPASVNVSPDPL